MRQSPEHPPISRMDPEMEAELEVRGEARNARPRVYAGGASLLEIGDVLKSRSDRHGRRVRQKARAASGGNDGREA